MKCNECKNAGVCIDRREFESLQGCTGGIPTRKVKTNADRIRNMSDEELAWFMQEVKSTCFVDFIGYADKDCKQDKISCKDCQAKAPTMLEWLKSEAE